jgi:PiT family inorganic phosphate transporter
MLSWFLITTLALGFYMAWNIGANDVANAMGTSVGSKALTLRKAVLVAAVLEFAGAFFVGSSVSETIQHGIISPEIFASDPMIFVLGMMSALLSTGLLLQLASYYGLPISTTHAIVGAVIGFGAVIGGPNAVHWGEVGQIASSWVISPFLSGAIAYGLFITIQKTILNKTNPEQAARKLLPALVFLCFTVTSMSFFFQGLKQLNLNLSFMQAMSSSCAVGLLAGTISYGIVRIQKKRLVHAGGLGIIAENGYFGVEKIFIALQIITACMVAFAHGANDVANAIGPVAAVLGVLKTHTVGSHSEIPAWLLSLGGAGIVIGLATWGWRVIETIGTKITELTPTRGFCAEFGAALTILLASKLGFPISTTHALVGAIFGVGLARGIEALNLKMLKDIVISWVVTIPLCALLCIIIFYFLRLIPAQM